MKVVLDASVAVAAVRPNEPDYVRARARVDAILTGRGTPSADVELLRMTYADRRASMNDLKLKLRRLLATRSVTQLVELLVLFKAQGGTKAEAYAALTELRSEAALAEYEDQILATMDLVVGWCSPHKRIWDDDDGIGR